MTGCDLWPRGGPLWVHVEGLTEGFRELLGIKKRHIKALSREYGHKSVRIVPVRQ